MKSVYIVKQVTIVATLGLALSAHAQLLGGRGAVGGMIGGGGGGAFGLAGPANIVQMPGRGSANSLTEITRGDSPRKSVDANGEAKNSGSASLLGNASSVAPAAPALLPSNGAAPSAAPSTTPGATAPATAAATQGKGIGDSANTAARASGNADASGDGNASAGLGMHGGRHAVGSVTEGVRNTAQPVNHGAQAQAEATRTFAQASGANVKNTAGQANAIGNGKQIAGAARSVNVQPQLAANGSAQGSGSGNGAGGVSNGSSASKGE